MENKKVIDSLPTDRTITVYWEKPELFLPKDSYKIYLNRELKGIVEKTHYEFAGLDPDTEYTIGIQWTHGEDEIYFGEVVVKTQKGKRILDITKVPYCASGDGKTLNTQAIQSAIDRCDRDSMVYIPEGVFLTGSLRLHSNMELYLDRNAVLQGTDCIEDYLPKIPSRFEGTEMMCYSSLLNLGELDRDGGYNCENVVIRGSGTIASGGRSLAEKIIAFETENMKDYLSSMGDKIEECEKAETIPGRLRPRLVNMSNCRNISISGLTLRDGASWNVHMVYSAHIVTNHCIFYSRGVWNGDGWDPDSSTDCTIFDCVFYTGDDAISIKSGKNPEGNKIGRPSRKIRIFDCGSLCGHGITIGSEMSGGIEDVSIWDCDMSLSRCGIEIKATKKRGGYVRNLVVRDCSVSRILFHSVDYNDDGEGAPVSPVFESCRFQNVYVEGAYLQNEKEMIPCAAIELKGFDDPGHELRNIVFEDIVLGDAGGRDGQKIVLKDCRNITFRNISCGKNKGDFSR